MHLLKMKLSILEMNMEKETKAKDLCDKVFELNANEFEDFLGHMFIRVSDMAENNDGPEFEQLQHTLALAYKIWQNREGN